MRKTRSQPLFNLSRRAALTAIVGGISAWAVYALVHFVVFSSHDIAERTNNITLILEVVFEFAFFLLIALVFQGLNTGRLRVQDQVRKLSRAVEQSPAGVMITDPAGRIEYVNPRFTQITGYTLDEVRGKNPNILQSGHTPPEVYADLWRTISAGREWRGDLHNRRKNGKLYWERSTIAPVLAPDGQVTHYISLKEDITDRKAIEAAERKARLLAEALRDTAAALNSELDIDRILKRILENVGRVIPHDVAVIMLIDNNGMTQAVHSHDSTGRGMDRWAHDLRLRVADVPDLRAVFETGRARVASDTCLIPEWIDFPEASWIRSNAVMPILRDERVIGFLELDSAEPGYFKPEHAEYLQAFADEVAVAIRNAEMFDALQNHAATLEQRVREHTLELQDQRAQLEAILDSMGEGVSYTKGVQILYVNRAMAQLFGYADPDDFPRDFTAPEAGFFTLSHLSPDEIRAAVLAHFRRGKPWREVLTMQRRDGTVFEAATTVAPVYTGSGRISGAVTIMRDVSQERALEDRKHRFLTHAAHELRTPLTNLMTRLYLIRQRPADIAPHLDVLDSVAEEMGDVVNDLLDIVRLGQGARALNLGPLDLAPVLAQALDTQAGHAAQRGVQVVPVHVPESLSVCGDRQRLAKAFARVLANSIQRTDPGGQVQVRLYAQEIDGVPYALLEIHDSGPLPDGGDVDQMLEPFFDASQANANGVALGLSVAHEIVRAHGGLMAVTAGDHGIVVTIRLAVRDGC